MFAHIRKHQRWLLVLIIGVVVVSFVIFFTPNVDPLSLGSPGNNPRIGTIDGQPVHNRDYQEVRRELELEYFINGTRTPNMSGDDFARQVIDRILQQERARNYGILASDSAAAIWTVNLFTFPDTNGVSGFHRNIYDSIRTNYLPRNNMNQADWDRFASSQVSRSQLYDMIGIPGELVPPREAEREFRKTNRKAFVQAAFFSRDNFMNLALNMDDLDTFYTNRMALYRTDPTRRLHHVHLATTNYLEQAETRITERTNFAMMIDRIWHEKGTNSFTLNGVVLEEGEAKDQIRLEEVNKVAVEMAWDKSLEFMRELAKEETIRAEALQEVATEAGFEAKVTEPFSRYQLIPGIQAEYSFTEAAFALTEEEPFTRPLRGSDGVFIFSLHSIQEASVPPLDEIRAQVQQDYLDDHALTSCREAAEAFAETIATRMEEGLTFAEACEKESREAVTLPAFSSGDTRLVDGDPRADFQALKRNVFTMAEGKPSKAVYTRDGAMVFQVTAFADPTREEIETGLPETLDSLRRSRRSAAMSAWQAQESAQASFPFLSQEEN